MNDRSDFESASAAVARYGGGDAEVLWHDRPTPWDSLCAACTWPWPMSLLGTGFWILWTLIMLHGAVLDSQAVLWWVIPFGLLMTACFAIWAAGPFIAHRGARRTIFALTKSRLLIIEQSARGARASGQHLISEIKVVRRRENTYGRGTLELTFGEGTATTVVRLAGVHDVFGLETLIASLHGTATAVPRPEGP
jgi:hypothetical protein